MQGKARGWGRRGWTAALLLVLAGCAPREEGLRVARAFPVAEPAPVTLSVGPEGRLWVAGRSMLTVLDSAGAVLERRAWSGEAPRVIGAVPGRVYVRGDDRLVALGKDLRTRGERVEAEGDRFVLDPRGRWVFQGTASGAVFGLDPLSLRPLWAWPKRGYPTTALAVSPEGDRLYQAISGVHLPRTAAAWVLTRDLQSGRILDVTSFSLAFRSLVAGPSGVLYGVAEGPDRAVVAALRPGSEGLRVLWRMSSDDLDLPRAMELRLDVAETRVAIFAAGPEGGVRVLDAATGERLGGMDEGPHDAAWTTGGALYLLGAREVRVVQ